MVKSKGIYAKPTINKKRVTQKVEKPSKFDIREMIKYFNVVENFKEIEELLYKLTKLSPSENTVEMRVRSAIVSSNIKTISKVSKSDLKIIKRLAELNTHIILKFPIENLVSVIEPISDEDFNKLFNIEVNAAG